MKFAEKYAFPVDGKVEKSFERLNDFKEKFRIRWGRIRFQVNWGPEANVKVIIKVYREDGVRELFLVDTDPYDVKWDSHQRVTRDFYIHPFPNKLGAVKCVKFSYVVHMNERSIPSQNDYILMDGPAFQEDRPYFQQINGFGITPNRYETHELDSNVLQTDVDWYNQNFESLRLTPKFTKGTPDHPFHPKTFIHDHIDKVIQQKRNNPSGFYTIKVCVDCIDDPHFINHLIHASQQGVWVQCIVDWRKMTLTNSDNYIRLKRSGIELLGVFCTPKDPMIEVDPDMHTKFIIFGEEDCLLGSFNITFDRWWANWESGMTFHSKGVSRLLDNIFQSIRGGVIQRYGVDPQSHFNLLYTFGRHAMLEGKYYRPHQAIIAEINRAKHSIKICLFLIGEMKGEYGDSVVDALIAAKYRGVDVQIIFNGHLTRQGDPGKEYTMNEELKRPLLPAVQRLKSAKVPIALAYGTTEHSVPYCPIHSKYCVIDEAVVLEGSFNWYNTSVFSHDLLVVANNPDVAKHYAYEFDQILNTFRIYY